MKNRKILIIRFSSLGDVVLVHPVIKELFDNGYTVDLLTKKIYKDIFKYNTCIDNILFLEDHKNLFGVLKSIRENKYYRILDLHRNLRTAFIKLFFFYKTITYKKYRFRRFLFFRFRINLLKNNYVIKNYLRTLQGLGIRKRISQTDYSIFFRKPGKTAVPKTMIVIAPFARYYTKEWVHYKGLIEILRQKYRVIIIGEQEDHSRAEKLTGKNVLNLCGKADLDQIASLIDKSRLLITNDSGIMHLGVGTKAPVISIFGSTSAEFGFKPVRKETIVIERKDLRCRPCDYHGRHDCPKEHFKCMRDISIDRVIKDAGKFIKI